MAFSDIWTYSELSAAVELALRIRDGRLTAADVRVGCRVNKSQAFYALTERLGKVESGKAQSKGPAERKVWNVSSLLIDAGFDGLSGFTFGGGSHYQFALIDALAVALRMPVPKLLARVNKGRAARGESTITLADLKADLAKLEHAEASGQRPERFTRSA